MNATEYEELRRVRREQSLEQARTFLLGEIMSAATRQLRAADKPWLRMPQDAQRKVIDEVREDCERAICRAVEIIASEARTVFVANVEQCTFKDGVKAVLTMPNNAAAHELADTVSGSVFVVIEDPSRYLALGDVGPTPMKDQAGLDLAEGEAAPAKPQAQPKDGKWPFPKKEGAAADSEMEVG